MNDGIPEIDRWLQPQESTLKDYQKRTKADDELRRVSKEFEAIMVSSIMKQGFKTAREISEDGGQDSSSKFMDMAYDQLADFMGRNAGMGLSDLIYQSLKQKGGNA
jgi:Rod binding domain-containing protein